MSEPIMLTKDGENMTVYGRHQAAVHVKAGWQLGEGQTVVIPPPPIDATPAAIKMAKAHGIDLQTVTGTGKGGKITIGDVEAIIDGA